MSFENAGGGREPRAGKNLLTRIPVKRHLLGALISGHKFHQLMIYSGYVAGPCTSSLLASAFFELLILFNHDAILTILNARQFVSGVLLC